MMERRKMSLIKPMISEKNAIMEEEHNRYVFQIIENANVN